MDNTDPRAAHPFFYRISIETLRIDRSLCLVFWRTHVTYSVFVGKPIPSLSGNRPWTTGMHFHSFNNTCSGPRFPAEMERKSITMILPGVSLFTRQFFEVFPKQARGENSR
jgi:hypothetical protein